MTPQRFGRLLTFFCFSFVLLTSFFTYVYRYDQPQAPFWDENYYITDAQRILNGVFFMQIHPPLGKMLIAMGEWIVDANEDDADLLETEHAGKFPKDFSFAGYRLFPVLLGWGTVLLLFGCFLILTQSPLLAALLSFLPMFDTALLLHSRGAMLDAPLHFFLILTILLFLFLIREKERGRKFWILSLSMGIAFGFAAVTKMNSLILLLLMPALLWHLRKETWSALKMLCCIFVGFSVIFLGIWYIHLARMEIRVPALRNNGFYETSETYRSMIENGEHVSFASFPMALREHLAYVPLYNRGIPKLDLCKPDENGSPVFLWPIGATAINYRWTSAGEGVHRYLTLVANPGSWLIGLLSVLLAGAFLVSPLFQANKRTELQKDNALLIGTFFCMYIGYLAAFMMMDRVNFLYSYLPALLISFLLFALVVTEARRIGTWQLNEESRTLGVMGLVCIVFLFFQFLRPFVYYEPLTKEQVENRALLRLWNLRCVGCEKPSPLVRRQCSTTTSPKTQNPPQS